MTAVGSLTVMLIQLFVKANMIILNIIGKAHLMVLLVI